MTSFKTKPLSKKNLNLSAEELEKKVTEIYEVPFSGKEEITNENREMFFKAFDLSSSLSIGFLPITQNPQNLAEPRMLRKFVEWIASGDDDQHLISSLINFSFTDKEQLLHHKWRVPFDLSIPFNNHLLIKFPPFNPSKVLFAPSGTTRAICRISVCIGDLSGNKLFRSTQSAVAFFLDNDLSYETEANFWLRMEKRDIIFVGMSLDFRNDDGDWTVQNPDQLPSLIVDAIYIE